MWQFFADQIDQMDLALDQLTMRDRNFSRFAFMLVDNVMELTLHQYAQEKNSENSIWTQTQTQSSNNQNLFHSALGPHFDLKLKLAKDSGLLSTESADSIQSLHVFRNEAHHQGLRHEEILHSLALFYFKTTCLVLENYVPNYWSFGSSDQVSYRAMKYMGNNSLWNNHQETIQAAWRRLREIAESMGDALVSDLHHDMNKTIETVDADIQFLADNSPNGKIGREQFIKSYVWSCMFLDKEKDSTTKAQKDPIPSWKNRLHLLKLEKNSHLALKKYSQFMVQTKTLREQIHETAMSLDWYIQEQLDIARGK